MKTLLHEHGLLVISMIIAGVMFLMFSRFMDDDTGLRAIYNDAVAWNGDYRLDFLKVLNGGTDGYLDFSDKINIVSSVDNLYKVNSVQDISTLEPPKLSVSNKDNTIIPFNKSVMTEQDWKDMIGISSDKPGDIIVLVKEYSLLDSDSAVSGYYYLGSDGLYHEYVYGDVEDVVLYELTDKLDSWGNKIPIENQEITYVDSNGEVINIQNTSGVKKVFDLAYEVQKEYTKEEISSGIFIDNNVSKKYKVTFRTEYNNLKAEYTILFVNQLPTSQNDIDDKLDDWIESNYAEEGI